MFQLVFTNRFRKDVNLLKKRGFDMDLLRNALTTSKNPENYLLKTDHINYQVIIRGIGRLTLSLIGRFFGKYFLVIMKSG